MLHKFLSVSAILGLFACAGSTAATAQNEAEFISAFSGEWEVYDEAFALNAQRCRLGLLKQAVDGHYAIENKSCAGELAAITRWGIAEGQMVMFAGAENVVTLGGNQHRMTGTTRSGRPVILERAGSAARIAERLASAHREIGCYYLGITETCAPVAEIAKPVPGAGSTPVRVNVLVNLNVRAEPREDAGVVGVVPANTCIVTEVCSTAADGVWCRARFGARAGWLRKQVLRQNRWPVITFVNSC